MCILALANNVSIHSYLKMLLPMTFQDNQFCMSVAMNQTLSCVVFLLYIVSCQQAIGCQFAYLVLIISSGHFLFELEMWVLVLLDVSSIM